MLQEAGLARTYSHPSYPDPYNVVIDYERVRNYHLSHPDQGSTVVARALDLPRARIRPWLNGSKPDPVRAIETAQRLGWFDATHENKFGVAFNRLIAASLSGGSISRSFEPRFVADTDVVDEGVRESLTTLAVGVREVNPNEANRPVELTPDSDRMLLGRVLTAIGVPLGSKTSGSVRALPSYLDNAQPSVRNDFVEIYLANRGVEFDGKDTVRIIEDRETQYRVQLANLLQEVIGKPVWVTEQGITISADAAREVKTVTGDQFGW
ncbi:hypothetical protein [Haloferax sp. DFSO52]|uniref:hypothetical protein n=1 Tax=Haloferax sp. DFSO52 TaxID=3388505 RepID=UPI003A876863